MKKLTAILFGATLALVACSSGSNDIADVQSPSEETKGGSSENEPLFPVDEFSAEEALEGLFDLATSGQWGTQYDALHPTEQKQVEKALYIECQSAQDEEVGNLSFDNFEVTATAAEPLRVKGTDEEIEAEALTFSVTLKVGIVEEDVTETSHLAEVNGGWVWFMTPTDFDAMSQGDCPNDSGSGSGSGEPPPQDAAVGDTVTLQDGSTITVHSFEKPSDAIDEYNDEYEPTAAAPHDQRASIDVEACGGSPDEYGDSFGIDSSEFELANDDNTRTEISYELTKEPTLDFTQLPEGQCVRGWVSFQSKGTPVSVVYTRVFPSTVVTFTI